MRFHPQRDQIIIQYKNLLHTFDLQQQQTVLGVHHALASYIVPQVLFSPNGGHFVSLGQGYVKLWDSVTGLRWRSWLTSYEQDVNEMQFNADGTKLAVAARTSLWCFDVNVPEQIFRKSSSESGDVARINFSPDGKVLLVARTDGVCQTWDIADGRMLHSWQIGGAPLFIRCGTHDAMDWVVTVTRSGVWQMWSWQLGEALSPPMLHGANVLSADLSPDGKTLVTAGENGIVRFWTLPGTCDESTSDLAKMARHLSTRQLDPNDGGLVAVERDPSTPIEHLTVRIDAENAQTWARRHVRESSMMQEWASVQRGAGRLLIESPNGISLLRLQAMARSRGSDTIDLESWDRVVQSEQSTAEDWKFRGRAFEKSKRYGDAIAAYGTALAKLPTDERLGMHRALLQLAAEQQDLFDESYRQMIQRHQAFRPQHEATTAVRLANRAEWQTTLELIETQLSSLSDSPADGSPSDSNGAKGRLQRARGYIHFRLGDWAQAKDDFMGALSDSPNETEVFRGLAWSCRVLGESQAALEHAKQGLTTNPDDANLHLVRLQVLILGFERSPNRT
ncbi:MAG: hypothetical protein IH991_21410 [Planctomycetes bacterium]|nr:hypothetical protein [Planctomycetota bacterium]